MALRIFTTGVRSGETIRGAGSSQKQSKDCVMQVRGEYPPSQLALSKLDATTLRDGFNRFAFFGNMSVEERRNWLQEHATSDKDLYMEDVPDLHVRLIKLGGFFTKQLTQKQIDTLLKGNPDDPEGYWPIQTVYNMFPRKPNSRARKHTLIFRPNNWALMESETLVEGFTGLYFDMDSLELKTGEVKASTGGYLRVFQTERMTKLIQKYAAVAKTKRREPLTWEHVLTLVGEYVEEMKRVRPLLEWFPPALHKSLIQKLIRTRCKWVEYAGVLYNAGSVLLTTITMLMLHPGSFVPNIQRFVTGLESAFKRVDVSICEDSFLEDTRLIALLYLCAQLAQQDRTWQPTDTIIMYMFQAALLAQQDPRIFDYDWKNFSGNVKKWDFLGFSYLLLAEIRSFQSDIDMVGSIAENGGVARKEVFPAGNQAPGMPGAPELASSGTQLMETMPLTHCVDQHTFTEIAHFLPYTGLDFGTVFNNIWNHCTGVNPRAEKYQKWKEDTGLPLPDEVGTSSAIVKDIRQAQRQLWISKIYTPQPRPVLESTVTFTYDLPPEWLAGLIGPIEIRVGSSTALVVLRCDDIYQYTAIKRPARDMKVPELTAEEKEKAIAKAIEQLQSGIQLEHVPSTLPQFKGAIVYLHGSIDSVDEPPEYYIRFEGKSPSKKPSPGKRSSPAKEPPSRGVKWSDAIKLSYTLPLHELVTPSIEDALMFSGDGIMKDVEGIFAKILEGSSGSVLRRLATYLEGSRTVIELHHIGRDGTGVDYAVLPEDTGVFHLLCYICCLYPAALVKIPSGFQVKNGPLLWSLRKQINTVLRGAASEFKDVWKIGGKDKRTMWEHQMDIDATLKARHSKGKRVHLIWVPVGLGKSMPTTSFIHWLIERKEMPEYCAWILPPSAVASIQKELDLAHLPHQTVDMKVKSRIRVLKPGVVNIILHDHMRMNGLDEELKRLAGEGRLFPVFDEFHKMMNMTQRTSIALEILRLARIAIGLSGTIVKDASMDGVREWLEQLVDFEVTSKNVMVAVGALISKKIVLPITVERVTVEAKLLDPDRYYSLVPKGLGGTANHLQFAAALKESYAAIVEELVNQALFYINAGEGIFVVLKDAAQQELVRDRLLAGGVKHIHLITNKTPINLTPEDESDIEAVLTTKQHVEGFTLTKFRIMLVPVILSNQTTREQYEGRLLRIGQRSPSVRYISIHSGILSYILKRYESARSLSEALKGFAQDIGLENIQELRTELL